MRNLFIVLLAVLVVLSFTTPTFAKAEKGPTTKLERGVKNLALGWTEIPKNIIDTSKKSGGVIGVTFGTIKGIFQAFARTVSGAVDVATFPAGTYDRPAVKPSMVPDAASGAIAESGSTESLTKVK